VDVEFSKVGPNKAASTNGFTVAFHPAAGLDYADCEDTIRVDTEVYVNPLRIAIYRESRSLRSLEAARVTVILANVVRAMKFLGHPTEVM
jgi:hypothetical protein